LLINHVDIYDQITAAQGAWANKQFEDFGFAVGKALSDLVVGDAKPSLSSGDNMNKKLLMKKAGVVAQARAAQQQAAAVALAAAAAQAQRQTVGKQMDAKMQRLIRQEEQHARKAVAQAASDLADQIFV